MFNQEKQRTPNSYFILNNNGRPSGFGIEPINDFIYCLQNDLPFIADGNDGLQAELIAEAVHESLETGKKVKNSKRLGRRNLSFSGNQIYLYVGKTGT